MSPILLGFAVGAGSAFLFDPQQGRRRRALLRDKVVRSTREAREFRDAVSDDLLIARARAKLRRYASHPHAVRVTAQNGYVTVSGDILAAEHGNLLQALRLVRGVRDCADRLDVHTSAEGISASQGAVPPPGQSLEVLQSRWSPRTRAIVGGTGVLLALYALARGGVRGVAALAGGAALIARAKANRPLFGPGARSQLNRVPTSAKSALTQ